MNILYIFCLIPVLIGFSLFLWTNYRGRGEICWKEWLLGSAAAFLIAAPIHYWSYSSQVGDYETWSGKIIRAEYIPKWLEYYQEAIYRTEYYTTRDSKGNTTRHSRRVFSHWEDRTRWHGPSWTAYSDIDTSYDIGEPRYRYFVKMFGNQSHKKGDRTTMEHNSRMISGDPMDYYTTCSSDFVEPITDSRWFENRIKATPSVFNFVEVPLDIPVFDYPGNRNPWQSNRVMGTASRTISVRLWDEMCARLGVRRYINLIIIQFDSADSMLAEWQKAHWLGGKKNDLVLCKGRGFTKVFGWSESDVCKRNLETLLLKHPLDNTILPLIEKEVVANYKKREFSEDFAYLSVEPQSHHWFTFIFLLLITQTGLYIYFHKERIFY